MQGLFILLVWSLLLLIGCAAPFVLALAYLWVDLFQPQYVSPEIGRLLPISMITAVLAIGGYLLADRRDPPRLGLLTALLLVWAAWITLTTTWALFPDAAWEKWDWAFKTVAFSTLLPFAFRTRIQIEAAVLVIVCTIFANVLPYAIKGLISGGGYFRALGLVGVNSGWGGEGSTLATYAFASLPLIAHLRRWSILAPARGLLRYAYIAAPAIAVLGAFATFARSAVVACLVWAALTWWHSRRKFAVAILLFAAGAVVVPLMGESWLARISTSLDAQQEASALTRLVVWGWTIDFANQHPQGGGFDAYLANHAMVAMPDGQVMEVQGRAFHSIFFEVLGEHGWVGAAIFGAILLTFFANMRTLRQRARDNESLQWLDSLALALMQSMVIYLAGAAFVGIAFQPLHYYLFALAVCATAFLARARVPAARHEAPEAPMPSWRLRARRSVSGA
ncbi:DUF5935 domain-containing protein [Neoroseomonas soli]|uniref:O-glycosylation ligase, exosortase A system-associated n=1 Tax=Neoroseomonas soli TaxID=1081025 RepID=A0A9X9WSM0_9PROT|nr:DUF5935 domain-containing protein [Neoroseomonas soli]MBR0670149.1 hypothetical protein [Neoroseomonas soli]